MFSKGERFVLHTVKGIINAKNVKKVEQIFKVIEKKCKLIKYEDYQFNDG